MHCYVRQTDDEQGHSFFACRGTENPTSHIPMQSVTVPEQSQQDPIDTPAPRQRNVTAGSSTAHPTLLAMI